MSEVLIKSQLYFYTYNNDKLKEYFNEVAQQHQNILVLTKTKSKERVGEYKICITLDEEALNTVGFRKVMDSLSDACETAYLYDYHVQGNVIWDVEGRRMVSVVDSDGILADFCTDFLVDSGVDNIDALRFIKRFYISLRSKSDEAIKDICYKMYEGLREATLKNLN